ncbi:hypothetical protein SEA_WINKNICK_32 [Gordonia phage WinkNick]|nr:hypothetical protein SEA_WINKNICK_32 [Gordonia phage WinkNick]
MSGVAGSGPDGRRARTHQLGDTGVMDNAALIYAVATHIADRHGGYAETAYDLAAELVQEFSDPRELFLYVAYNEAVVERIAALKATRV